MVLSFFVSRQVCTEGRLILEFGFDDMMRIRNWHFAIRTHCEMVPRNILSRQDPAILEQVSKNITRQGMTNITLNYLRVSLQDLSLAIFSLVFWVEFCFVMHLWFSIKYVLNILTHALIILIPSCHLYPVIFILLCLPSHVYQVVFTPSTLPCHLYSIIYPVIFTPSFTLLSLLHHLPSHLYPVIYTLSSLSFYVYPAIFIQLCLPCHLYPLNFTLSSLACHLYPSFTRHYTPWSLLWTVLSSSMLIQCMEHAEIVEICT